MSKYRSAKTHLKFIERRRSWLKKIIKEKDNAGRDNGVECAEYNALTWAIINLQYLVKPTHIEAVITKDNIKTLEDK